MDITKFEEMLETGQDNALIRFTMASAFMQHKKYDQAIEHLKKAIEHEPEYSAAWKLYGRCLFEMDKNEEAQNVYEKGLQIAQAKGDMQTVREIEVFLKRLQN